MSATPDPRQSHADRSAADQLVAWLESQPLAITGVTVARDDRGAFLVANYPDNTARSFLITNAERDMIAGIEELELIGSNLVILKPANVAQFIQEQSIRGQEPDSG